MSLLWLPEISTAQLQCRNEVEKQAWTVWRNSRPPKTLQSIFRKVWKNGVHMVTDFHRKQEPCFQGGEDSSIRRYCHKALGCVCPRTPGTSAVLLPGLGISFSCILPFSLPLYPTPLSNPHCCVLILEGQGLTHQFSCQV